MHIAIILLKQLYYSRHMYLYSAAYLRVLKEEQSTSSPFNARLTGQYSLNSPRDNLKSDGVIHKPAIDAA